MFSNIFNILSNNYGLDIQTNLMAAGRVTTTSHKDISLKLMTATFNTDSLETKWLYEYGHGQ